MAGSNERKYRSYEIKPSRLTSVNLSRSLSGAAARGEDLTIMVGVRKGPGILRNIDYLWRSKDQVGLELTVKGVSDRYLVGWALTKKAEVREIGVRIGALLSCNVFYFEKAA